MTTQVSFKADPAAKAGFDHYAKSRGVSAASLFNSFMRFVAANQRVPFTVDGVPAVTVTRDDLLASLTSRVQANASTLTADDTMSPELRQMIADEDAVGFTYDE